MKSTAAIALAAAIALPAGHAYAQDRPTGTWRVESVNASEPPEQVELTLTFGNDALSVTYTTAGDAQSWDYNLAFEDGQITITPIKAFGEPQEVTYDIRYDAGKLLLLPPKPEPITPEEEEDESAEGDDETAEETGDAAGDADADATDADTTEADDAASSDDTSDEDTADESEAEEEADTRTPVWILVKA